MYLPENQYESANALGMFNWALFYQHGSANRVYSAQILKYFKKPLANNIASTWWNFEMSIQYCRFYFALTYIQFCTERSGLADPLDVMCCAIYGCLILFLLEMLTAVWGLKMKIINWFVGDCLNKIKFLLVYFYVFF